MTRTDPARVALLFSGQGAQHAGMAAGLYRSEPVFAAVVDRCAAAIDAELPVPLRDVLFAAPGSEHAALLDQTAFTQPALFAVEVGLAELWRSWGITPFALIGHSVGEYAAAVVAGVLDVEAGARLIAARGRLMQALPAGGAMTAVFTPVAEVEAAIAALSPSDRDVIGVAAINGPAHTVVSGAADAVAAVAAALAASGARVQPLAVSHAFHSPLMAPMLDEFAEVARSTAFAAPRRRVVSNLTGAVAGDELADPEHWVRHVLAPVRFADGIAAVLGLGVDTLIEVGPHPVLVGMGQACVEPGTATWVGSLRRGRDDDQQLMTALAELFVAGVDVDWEAVHRGRGRRVDAPTTPFQRQRHWVRATRRPAAAGGAAPGAHPLLGARWRSPSRSRTYAAELATASFGFLDDHRVAGTAITPAAAFVEVALAAARDVASGASGFTAPVAVEDVVIHAAMALPDDGVALLQTIVDGDTIEVHGSRDGEAWTLHAAARTAPAATPARLDVAAVVARTGAVLGADEHHELLHGRGLDFGPSLRGVAAIHVGDGEAIGEVRLPESELGSAARYGIHPALLDAALQVLGAVAVAATGDDGAVYLPVAIDRVTLHRAGATQAWSHARLREVAPGAPTLTADVLVADATGAAIATVEGLRLARADEAALARLAGAAGTDDWLYTVAWRRRPDADEGSATRPVLAPVAAMADAAGAAIEPVAADVALDRHQAMLDELEAISTELFVEALAGLGARVEPGGADRARRARHRAAARATGARAARRARRGRRRRRRRTGRRVGRAPCRRHRHRRGALVGAARRPPGRDRRDRDDAPLRRAARRDPHRRRRPAAGAVPGRFAGQRRADVPGLAAGPVLQLDRRRGGRCRGRHRDHGSRRTAGAAAGDRRRHRRDDRVRAAPAARRPFRVHVHRRLRRTSSPRRGTSSPGSAASATARSTSRPTSTRRASPASSSTSSSPPTCSTPPPTCATRWPRSAACSRPAAGW